MGQGIDLSGDYKGKTSQQKEMKKFFEGNPDIPFKPLVTGKPYIPKKKENKTELFFRLPYDSIFIFQDKKYFKIRDRKIDGSIFNAMKLESGEAVYFDPEDVINIPDED